MKPESPIKPLVILAALTGIALCILALLYGFSKWLIPAVKVAFTTFTVAGTVSPIIVQTGAITLIATTSITFVTLAAKAVPKVKKDPFPWTIGILTLWNPLAADLCKELYEGNTFQKVILKAAVAASFALAAILWKRGDTKRRILAIFLFLLSPVVMFGLSVRTALREEGLGITPGNVGAILMKIPALTWLGISLTIILIVVAVTVDRILPQSASG